MICGFNLGEPMFIVEKTEENYKKIKIKKEMWIGIIIKMNI